MTFDTDYTDDPICPTCGHAQTDAWEIGMGEEGDLEDECGSCGQRLFISRHLRVNYSTAVRANG